MQADCKDLGQQPQLAFPAQQPQGVYGSTPFNAPAAGLRFSYRRTLGWSSAVRVAKRAEGDDSPTPLRPSCPFNFSLSAISKQDHMGTVGTAGYNSIIQDEKTQLLTAKSHANMRIAILLRGETKYHFLLTGAAPMCGVVTVNVYKKCSARKITVEFVGQEHARWRESRGSGKSKRRVTVRRHCDIQRENIVVWRPPGSSNKIEVGNYELKFQFRVLPSAPPTMCIGRETRCWTTYNIKANVDKPWWFDMSVGCPVVVRSAPVDPLSLPQIQPQVMEQSLPVYYCCCCFRIGDVDTRCQLSRAAFACSEVNLNPTVVLDMKNTSTRPVRGVRFSLIAEAKFWRKSHRSTIGTLKYHNEDTCVMLYERKLPFNSATVFLMLLAAPKVLLNPKAGKTETKAHIALSFGVHPYAVPSFRGQQISVEHFLVVSPDIPYAVDPSRVAVSRKNKLQPEAECPSSAFFSYCFAPEIYTYTPTALRFPIRLFGSFTRPPFVGPASSQQQQQKEQQQQMPIFQQPSAPSPSSPPPDYTKYQPSADLNVD
eukprot:jgi/Bigna1/85424/estExt_fgenesh1_pg.C_40058